MAIKLRRPTRSEQKPIHGLKTIFAMVKTEKMAAKWSPVEPISLT